MQMKLEVLVVPVSFVRFKDPEGNGLVIRELNQRAPGR
jgi:hypothetical protein